MYTAGTLQIRLAENESWSRNHSNGLIGGVRGGVGGLADRYYASVTREGNHARGADYYDTADRAMGECDRLVRETGHACTDACTPWHTDIGATG